MAAPFLTSVQSVTLTPLDLPAPPRAQPVLHVGPLDARTVVAALTPALARVEAGTPGVQVLVVLPDAGLGVEAAELMPGVLSAFTSSARGARLLAHAAPTVVTASLGDALALVRGAQLKLDVLAAVIVAGVDVLLARDADALDALLAEVPADALRIATSATENDALASFAERHLRRARREALPAGTPATIPVHGLAVSNGGRGAALRALLDAFDPPSAAIVVTSEDEARAVRGALAAVGLSGNDPLAAVVTAAQVSANVALLVCWTLPADAATLAALAASTPVRLVVLHDVRERARLLALAGGSLLPLDLPAPLDALRRRDAMLRSELERELSSGAPLREAQALAPLLAAHDGVSIAAAAVRLLERERAVAQLRRAAFVAPAAPASAPAERGERAPRSGGPGARDDRGARPPRGKFGDRDAGAPRDRKFASRDDRGERPPRAKFGDRPSGPPRGGKFADRGPRPPRAGGKFPDRGERPASGPRGPVRGSRGPAEGGDRAEWTDRGEQLRRAKKPPREE